LKPYVSGQKKRPSHVQNVIIMLSNVVHVKELFSVFGMQCALWQSSALVRAHVQLCLPLLTTSTPSHDYHTAHRKLNV
jgi:hypothetical protein